MSLPIIQAAAAYFGCSLSDLVGVRRHKALNIGRYAAMHILRHRDGISLAQIGKHFGGRDHSTVFAALQHSPKFLETHEGFAAFVTAQMERPKYDKSPVILPPLVGGKITRERLNQRHLPPVSMVASAPPKPLRIVEYIPLYEGKTLAIDQNGDTMGDIAHRRNMAAGSRKLAEAMLEAMAA